MLGNWSLGDYFKKEQLEWFFTFLTDEKVGVDLNPKNLYVTVFRGQPELKIPRDEEAAQIWQKLFASQKIDPEIVDFSERNGMQSGRIFYYAEKKNYFSPMHIPHTM